MIYYYVYFKEENDNLRCQLEAYKNEVHILRSESHCELEIKNQEIKDLQGQLAELEVQLTQAKRAQASESVKLLAMEAKLNAKEKLGTPEKFDVNKIKDDKDCLPVVEQNEKVCYHTLCQNYIVL